MLKIVIPNNNLEERIYIIDVIFDEFLGVEYQIIQSQNCKAWKIELNSNELIIEDTFFSNYPEELSYLKFENIPKRLDELDIFAACFFMLTRWEEYVNTKRDKHNRFLASYSLAYKEGFLDRAVVNEYIEELKEKLIQLDNRIEFKFHKPNVFVSCDVDQPYDCTVSNLNRLIRVGAGDILKRKSMSSLLKRIRRYIFNKFGNYKYDENYTFDWYMDICDRANLKAAFYFIPTSVEEQNGCFEMKDKNIQTLLNLIDKRGHKIGVHGSYQTYQDKDKAKKQKNILDKELEKLNISQKVLGNRQHYLRWDSAITPNVLDYAGFEYDTTGSYADRPGFRCGTCYTFSMFDILNRKKLNLKQIPLIVMECSVIDEPYMGLGYTKEALNKMREYKEICFKYNGNFSLLWHNSSLKTNEAKKIFEGILED